MLIKWDFRLTQKESSILPSVCKQNPMSLIPIYHEMDVHFNISNAKLGLIGEMDRTPHPFQK